MSRCWASHQKGRGKLREMLSDVVESVLFLVGEGRVVLYKKFFFGKRHGFCFKCWDSQKKTQHATS